MLRAVRTLMVRVGISVLSLAGVFFLVRGEIAEGFARLAGVDVWFVGLAFAMNFLSLTIVSIRMSRIFSIQGVHVPFRRSYYLWVISLFFNLFLPSAVGGDIAKAYYIARDSGKKVTAVTGVLLDRFFGLMSTISVGFIAFIVGRDHIHDPHIGQVLFWVTAVVLIGVLFLMSRRFSKPAKSILFFMTPGRFHDRLKRIFEMLDLYRGRRADFFMLYGYSLMAQALFVVMVYLLARSIGIRLPLTIFFLFMPLISVTAMLPSIGGLGVREAATVYLFQMYLSLEEAVAISLVFDLFIYGIGGICGILYALRGGASIRELQGLEASNK